MTDQELSVADIKAMLREKQAKLSSLEKRRDSLTQKLQDVEQQIAEISGVEGSGGTRFRNDKSLHQFILDVLKKNKKGLGLSDLTNAVLDAGYKTGSNNFKNVIYQNLYNSEEIVRDEKTGRYVLA